MKSHWQAKLVIHDLDKMTSAQRSEIVRWIQRQARFIRPMRREFSSRYIARISK